MSETLSGGTVSIPVRPDTRGFGQQMHRGIMGAGLGGIGMAAGGLLLAGIGLDKIARGIGKAIHTGFSEAFDASAGIAQLNAGLKSTNGISGTTTKQLTALAGKIQDMSGQTDDSIVATEKLLLTFTKIRNVGADKIFDQTTQAAADMAAKMGGDASSKAIQLGKALNDPVKGMTALARVGVSFTAQQKAQNKALVEGGVVNAAIAMGLVGSVTEFNSVLKRNHDDVSKTVDQLTNDLTPAQKKLYDHYEEGGHIIEAQKNILKELNTEFGGSAKAAGESLPGALNRMKRGFEDVAQMAAETLTPSLAKVFGHITDLEHSIRDSPGFQIFLKRIGAFADNQAGKIGKAFDSLGKSLAAMNGSGFKGIAQELGKVSPMFLLLADLWPELQPVFPALAESIGQVAEALAPLLPELTKAVIELLPSLADVIIALVPVIPPVAWLLTNLIVPALAEVADNTSTFSQMVRDMIGILSGDIGTHAFLQSFKDMKGPLANIIHGIVNVALGLINGYIDALNGIRSAIEGFLNTITGVVGGPKIHFDILRHVSVEAALIASDKKQKSAGHGKTIAMADGGTIMPRPGGTQVTLAEAGRAESVVDSGLLNKRLAEQPSGERPIYADGIGLIGWLKEAAGMQAQLVFNRGMADMALQQGAGGTA